MHFTAFLKVAFKDIFFQYEISVNMMLFYYNFLKIIHYQTFSVSILVYNLLEVAPSSVKTTWKPDYDHISLSGRFIDLIQYALK